MILVIPRYVLDIVKYPGGYVTLPLHGECMFAMNVRYWEVEENAGKNLIQTIGCFVCLHRGLWNVFNNTVLHVVYWCVRKYLHAVLYQWYHSREHVEWWKVQKFLLPTFSRRLNLGQRLSLSWFGLSSELSDPEAWSCIDLASYCHGAVHHWLLFTTWWYCCISNKRVCSRNIFSKYFDFAMLPSIAV